MPSNWFNTNDYVKTGNEIYKGVYILDKSIPERLQNMPFLHNALIDTRDDITQGGLRKACRLMKSLKYDYENINLSSYDIVSIVYNMPDDFLNYPKGKELMILFKCIVYCKSLVIDQEQRESIKVPDKHRNIFTKGHATLEGLNQMVSELERLEQDILYESHRSFNKLNEARIIY